jgi:hypothetical protein
MDSQEKLSVNFGRAKVGKVVKNPKTVMPDSIRHPEHIGIPGFPLSRE